VQIAPQAPSHLRTTIETELLLLAVFACAPPRHLHRLGHEAHGQETARMTFRRQKLEQLGYAFAGEEGPHSANDAAVHCADHRGRASRHAGEARG